MEQLTALTEQLAASAVLADATDLPALADLHSRLQAIERFVTQEAPAEARQGLGRLLEATTAAEQQVERIILREVDDADAALKRVNATIIELQRMAQGQSVAGPAAAPATTTAGADAPASDAPATTPAAAFALVDTARPAPQAAVTPTAAPAQVLTENAINPDDLGLVTEFIAESNGHLESAEGQLLKLEEDPQNLEIVAAIFRSFHTIKGVAGFLNLKQVGALSHAAENLLDMARHGTLELTGVRLDVVLESLDTMKAMLKSLDEAARQSRPIPVCETLPALLEKLHALGNQAAAPTAAHASTPAAQAAAPTSAAPAAASTVPAPSPENAAPTATATASATATTPQQNTAPTQAQAQGHGSAAADATVKVSTDRLDNLINMVGELVIAQAMVAQDTAAVATGNQRLARNMGHLGKITRELQDLSMSMRMVPIQGVFQKMARLVRDIGRRFEKEVDLKLIGGETELDRNVVEAISDPLVHMVRNAVDHGIEPPHLRELAGKPRAGQIELKAFHQAGSIVIEIRDDGRGLNKAKLLKKAIEAGIVREGQEVSEQDIFRLVFHPGLSTADKVTDISGRGVGMDVVRKNVEAMRGRIDIVSAEGKGSTFTLRLPLTLAVIDGLVVQVGRERYIVPLTSVEQSLRPRAEQIATLNGRGEMCNVRDRLLPLVRLHRLFGVSPASEDPTQALVVIVQDEHRRCCLLVDELLGQQQVVIKSLGEALGAVKGISGGAILGDGNISLILDVPGLITIAGE